MGRVVSSEARKRIDRPAFAAAQQFRRHSVYVGDLFGAGGVINECDVRAQYLRDVIPVRELSARRDRSTSLSRPLPVARQSHSCHRQDHQSNTMPPSTLMHWPVM